VKLLGGLKFMVVQGSVLHEDGGDGGCDSPGSAGWCETEGTVTSSSGVCSVYAQPLPLPDGVLDDMEIIFQLAGDWGNEWGKSNAEKIWNEVRELSPMHAG